MSPIASRMHPIVESLQLGRYGAVSFDLRNGSWALVLPGAGYSVQAPLLWYARRAALAAGRSVLTMTDRFDRTADDPVTWVEERCRAALDRVRSEDEHPLVIAKSLTSLAAPITAREGLRAVWLTPLIATRASSVAAQVVAGLRAATAPQLLIGGSDDPTWDGGVAATLSGAEVLELPDADHGLEVPDDMDRSLEHLARVTAAVHRFIREPR